MKAGRSSGAVGASRATGQPPVRLSRGDANKSGARYPQRAGLGTNEPKPDEDIGLHHARLWFSEIRRTSTELIWLRRFGWPAAGGALCSEGLGCPPLRLGREAPPTVKPLRAFAIILLGALASGVLAAEFPPEDIEFFENKIRPLLVESCYKCHSTEAGKSKGGLKLDTRDGLRLGGGTGVAIVPGAPERSLLIEAVRYGSEDLQMPPKDEGGKLSAEKISLLEQWIKLGAPDPRAGTQPHPLDMAAARRHWAFQPVVKPAVPAVKNASRVATPVDAFVLAQLEANQLAPAPAAEPRTLLRRVTYDLTGLPPTAEATDEFLRDYPRDPGAYARVVERLLASPAYGERWGRFWLDVARYADTQGYLVGNAERRFAFSHTYRDYVIRAFNDDKPFDQFIVEQLAADRLPLGEDKSALAALGFLTLGRRFLGNQNDIIDDRIDVVTRGLMGLTVTCARCHDHKFDPIPAKDYYALHGIFASSEEPAEKPLLGPLVEGPAYQEFLRKRAEGEEKVKERERSEVEKFLAELRNKSGDYLLGARDAARLKPDEKLELFAGTRKLNFEVLKRWQAYLAVPARAADPVFVPWFALAALAEDEFAEGAARLIEKWKTGGTEIDRALVAAFAKNEKPAASLRDVAAVYNRVFEFTEKSPPPAEPREAEVGKRDPVPPPAPGVALPDIAPDAAQEAIRRLARAEDFPANLGAEAAARMIRRQLNTKTAALRRDLEALNWTEPGAPLRAMALVDKGTPRNSPVFLRGNPANKGPEVPRQFLEVLAGERRVSFQDGSGRLELAREIASPANPLTARVFVNRVWGWHFGQALVRTPSDFGVRTETPLQRELLDWLAATLVESGWSVKHLHRAIVRSHTYRQSSDATPAAAATDPDNQFLTRFNRRRLEFEALRDTLLSVSGQLESRRGGLPDDLIAEPFTKRRTVYGFVDRQNLPGMFRTFDYPNPDVSSVQRFATTVPQQALFLLNSPFVLEAARRVVARIELVSEGIEARKVAALYELLCQRAPEPEEREMALAFVRAPSVPRPPLAVGEGQASREKSEEAASGGPAAAKSPAQKKAGAKMDKVVAPKPPPVPLTRWEELAQVFLLSNELAFVD